MVPVVALVGRPNVGKSTLFNGLTKSNDALIMDLPGTTRDRQYGSGRVGKMPYILIDTGGVGNEQDLIASQTAEQSWAAVHEADLILFIVDGQAGISPIDRELAQKLRQVNKKIYLIVNKSDKLNIELALMEFHELSLGTPFPISAINNKGINKLSELFLEDFTPLEKEDADSGLAPGTIQVAVVGQPNVGKSTLMNKILQENRLVVNELAGTTRDSISLPFTRSGKNYSLIDTAGIRRRAKVDNVIEKFSVVKSLQAIETCNVVILMLDATRGVLDQDLHLLDFIVEQGRALVIVFNKWDIATEENQSSIKKQVNDRLHFVEFAKHHYISALRGTGIAKLFKYIDTAYQCAMQDLPTSKLNLILEDLLKTHQPPLVHGRRIKLRYAHSGGKNPPRIIIHGNQTEQVPTSYKRFLIKGYIKALKLEGTPLKIQFKTGDNPYKDKRNELTDSQKRRRNRVKKIFGWIKKK